MKTPICLMCLNTHSAWNVNSAQWEPCSKCTVPDSTPQPDVRQAIAATFKDYADQALAQGDRYAHGLWNQAASIAHDFVIRPKGGPR